MLDGFACNATQRQSTPTPDCPAGAQLCGRVEGASATHLDVVIAMLGKEGHEESFDGLAAVQCTLCAHLQPATGTQSS